MQDKQNTCISLLIQFLPCNDNQLHRLFNQMVVSYVIQDLTIPSPQIDDKEG